MKLLCVRFTDLFQCLHCSAEPAPGCSSKPVCASLLWPLPSRPANLLGVSAIALRTGSRRRKLASALSHRHRRWQSSSSGHRRWVKVDSTTARLDQRNQHNPRVQMEASRLSAPLKKKKNAGRVRVSSVLPVDLPASSGWTPPILLHVAFRDPRHPFPRQWHHAQFPQSFSRGTPSWQIPQIGTSGQFL